MDFLKDLWLFLVQQKKWWLIPVILALLTMGLFMLFAESSAVATFIYPLF